MLVKRILLSRFRHFGFAGSSQPCITGSDTLEGGDPSAGSPTDTLLQLSPSRKTQNQCSSIKNCTSSGLYSNGLMGGVCKAQGRIHRAIVTRDYWGFQLHEGEFQPSVRTEIGFRGLPCPFGLGTHCPNHCVPRVAQEIRAIQIYRSPLLPRDYSRCPHRVLPSLRTE